MNQLAEGSATEEGLILDRLQQCKLSLKEKLETLKTLDQEILMLIEDDAVEDEIEQADVFKERVQQSVFSAERFITLKIRATTITTNSRPSLHANVSIRETDSDEVATTTSLPTAHSDPIIVDDSRHTVKLPKKV